MSMYWLIDLDVRAGRRVALAAAIIVSAVFALFGGEGSADGLDFGLDAFDLFGCHGWGGLIFIMDRN